jgi:hypothetical protein
VQALGAIHAERQNESIKVAEDPVILIHESTA